MARKKRERSVAPVTPMTAPRTGAAADPSSGGQSGDLQGLSDTEEAGPQSVRELAEEEQAFEASVIMGIENAPAPDEGEVKTHEVPEDDVPPEYTDRAPDEPKEE